jgi:hypothetical protein
VLCFEVRLNGERLTAAGVESGVLSAVLSGVITPTAPPELSLEVAGLTGDTHMYWAEPKVRVGDHIDIRIVDADTVDAPVRERRESPEQMEQAERRYYERLKAKYEG